MGIDFVSSAPAPSPEFDTSASSHARDISLHASTPEGAADAANCAQSKRSKFLAFEAPKRISEMLEVGKLLTDDPIGALTLFIIFTPPHARAPGGWEKAWKTCTTPWLLGGVMPALAALVAAPEGSPLHLPPSIRRVLVPGCGNVSACPPGGSTECTGYDVEALASGGREATGLDISASAVAHAEKRVEGAGNRAAMAFECADFFEYRPAQPFDAIFDLTFFCALPPSLRGKWAAKSAELLAPQGVFYTLMYPLDDHEGGPPYAVSKDRCIPLAPPPACPPSPFCPPCPPCPLYPP
ncbi:unnamed protein product [Closterium sp. NIES-64]|nr:unnamed protein product [Closterium sp. NIES-64]